MVDVQGSLKDFKQDKVIHIGVRVGSGTVGYDKKPFVLAISPSESSFTLAVEFDEGVFVEYDAGVLVKDAYEKVYEGKKA